MANLIVKAMAAMSAEAELKPFQYELGALGEDQVDIAVESCGMCHSDISMIDNAWQMSAYPLVPGHEAVGKIIAVGSRVTQLKIGDRVGVGWHSHSCGVCTSCLAGDQHLCAKSEGTIVGRHGGFATHVRAQAKWAIPLPAGLDAASAGPLFCGGITVFSPLLLQRILPIHRVGVVGIGGLGHMALQFLLRWGCEVTAFSSDKNKAEELKKMGVHRVVNSRSDSELKTARGSLDHIISTVNVTMNWDAILNCLKSKGNLHLVGAALEPIPLQAFSLIGPQKSVSGSPTGAPATMHTMLDFCCRHKMAPQVEYFKLSEVNKAIQHLKAGKARYRIVLKNDLG